MWIKQTRLERKQKEFMIKLNGFMMTFQRITTANVTLYNYMEELLVSSFPKEEYRDLEELRRYTDSKEKFHNNVIFASSGLSSNESTPIGLLTYWDFTTFYYVEHFAIAPQARNGGYGRQALEYLCRSLPRPIILEVEMPDEEIARRRINFYQRQGFRLWQLPYQQPPYRKGEAYLPLLLMSYGNIDCNKEFDNIKQTIYREVYGI